MTRFPGVTAVPVISGMPSGSWEGVWGLCCPTAWEIRRLAGVAVEARIELRWASCCAWRRMAFSCRSSLSGTLRWLATQRRGIWSGAAFVLDGCLLRRGSRGIFGGARHGGGYMRYVDDAPVAGRCLLSGGCTATRCPRRAPHILIGSVIRRQTGRQAADRRAAPPHRHHRRRRSIVVRLHMRRQFLTHAHSGHLRRARRLLCFVLSPNCTHTAPRR